ncbi:hypothetical protein GMRT_12667 [Giardia muris]|uniref:Uncharacterized protein n=1 Tax=Giardia muris TaxID=5742 RepID=A0A4Z1T5Q4_GIAMU|nr:hypothetical protein GMRT_12667 [Giardia muris]|eukprot:TNJ27859.1 hypothetical protein GMRT_12667 [Giardia muris]
MRTVDVLVVGGGAKALRVMTHLTSFGLVGLVVSADPPIPELLEEPWEVHAPVIYRLSETQPSVTITTLESADSAAMRVTLGYRLAILTDDMDPDPVEKENSMVTVPDEPLITAPCMGRQISLKECSLFPQLHPMTLKTLKGLCPKVAEEIEQAESVSRRKRVERHLKPKDLRVIHPKAYLLLEDVPIEAQLDLLIRNYLLPPCFNRCRITKATRLRLTPDHSLLVYGMTYLNLKGQGHLTLSISHDTNHTSLVYTTQMGVVMGMELFLPEATSLCAALIPACERQQSIISLLSIPDSQVSQLVQCYYRELTRDETMRYAIQLGFRHYKVIRALVFLAPLLILLVILTCFLLII